MINGIKMPSVKDFQTWKNNYILKKTQKQLSNKNNKTFQFDFYYDILLVDRTNS